MARNTLTATVQTRLDNGDVLAQVNRPRDGYAALVAAQALTTTSMGTFTTSQVATLTTVQADLAITAIQDGANVVLTYDTTAVPSKNVLKKVVAQLLTAVAD